jgi:hypothetical protein
MAAFLCFVIAAGLMIASMLTSPVKANDIRAAQSAATQKSASAAHPGARLR